MNSYSFFFSFSKLWPKASHSNASCLRCAVITLIQILNVAAVL